MRKTKLVTAISASLLTFGAVNTAMAHDLVAGAISGTHKVDVYRTQCFTWSAGTDYAHITNNTGYDLAPAGELAVDATGLRFAVNLYPNGVTVTTGYDTNGNPVTATTNGNSVTATVGFTSTGNIAGPAGNPNNVLPSSPAPVFKSVVDTTRGTPWTNTTLQPDFKPNGNAPTGWSSAQWVNSSGVNPTGSGEYVIVIENSSTSGSSSVVGYDFIGHCQNVATSGTTAGNHTGQGTWFSVATASGTLNLLAPGADYDQVIDQ
jgi:hypothetical protein